MTSKVYLVARFVMIDNVPVFHDVDVYGEYPLTSLSPSTERQWLLATTSNVQDYDSGRAALIRAIRHNPSLSWVLPHLKEGS